MNNPAYNNNNAEDSEFQMKSKKSEDDLWELPELKSDEKSWSGK